MVTRYLPGVSNHDQVKNFESVTGGWNKVEGGYFHILFLPLDLLFCFIYYCFDFPA